VQVPKLSRAAVTTQQATKTFFRFDIFSGIECSLAIIEYLKYSNGKDVYDTLYEEVKRLAF